MKKTKTTKSQLSDKEKLEDKMTLLPIGAENELHEELAAPMTLKEQKKSLVASMQAAKEERFSAFRLWMVEHRGEFLVAVLSSTDKLNKFLARSTKDGKGEKLSTRLVPLHSYPIFILEVKKENEKNFLMFQTQEEAKDEAKKLQPSISCCFEITEDFLPEDYSKNHMKYLKLIF